MPKETVFIVSAGEQSGIKDILAPYDYWKNTRFVGVDKGAATLLKLGYPLDLAIGDFDSLPELELKLIKRTAKYIESFSSIKDDTDTQLALVRAVLMYPLARRFILLGAGGKRMDHFLSNLFMVLEPRFQTVIDQIYFQDKYNEIHFLQAGTHTLKEDKAYQYIGFASLSRVTGFEIQGAKYELPPTNLKQMVSYPSNEFVENEDIMVRLSSGIIAVIRSKD
ncbi:MAG: thiamine diphosphokinase [Streptococcaceae bacterium]|jgi:thiamine pyrophosphokinase|nr:thiamine diphosphokinase [Streptococcaceae bacterium]